MTTTTTIDRHPRVPGVRVELDPVKLAKGYPKPWGLWIEVKLPGITKRVRDPQFFATEEEAEAGYADAAARVAALREHAALQWKLKQGLNVPKALPHAPENVVLFETLARRWLDETIRPPRRKASTYKGYLIILEKHLFPLMREWPVTDEVMTVQQLTDVLKDELYKPGPGRPEGLSFERRLDCQGVLSKFFKWVLTTRQVSPKVLGYNPVASLGEVLKQEDEFEEGDGDTIPNPMTHEQRDAFLAWQKARGEAEGDLTLYRLFLWLAYQGSRLGEACALKWTAINLDDEQAQIKETYSAAQRWYEIQQAKAGKKGKDGQGLQATKTRTSQWTNLQPEVIDELRLHKQDNLAAWLKRGRYGAEPEWVFLNATNNENLKRGDRIYDRFREGCEALGLVGEDTGKKFTVHSLRATFITCAIRDGHDIEMIALHVGHKGTGTINKHYYRYIQKKGVNPFRKGARR